MKQKSSSDFKLGIISGGQLGKMLTQAASVWDVQVYAMDKSPEAPVVGVCHRFFQGDKDSFDDVYNFGKQVDMLTFEIEHINIEALKRLKAEGVEIYPTPETLEIIRDKGVQKELYKKKNIPTSEFRLYDGSREILQALDNGLLNYPFVQKARTEGYDGRGVAVIKTAKDLDSLMDTPNVVEDLVDINKELAVIVARNKDGDVKCFPLVEMEFNEANMLEQLVCPADVSEQVVSEAEHIAVEVAKALDLVGILAVELFLTKGGEILVNESAPRAHNSGHYTIEACITSQYEQQLRAIFNWALGDVSLLVPAVMINLLGEKGYSGKVVYEGLEEVLKLPGVKPHIYGKKETRPFRKMGHITILGRTMDDAKRRAETVRDKIRVIADEKEV